MARPGMKLWLEQLRQAKNKRAFPILSFPSVQLMGITVRRLISDSALQAEGMELVSRRVNSCAAVSMMDLSVEAEAFGAPVRFSDDEIPAVTAPVVLTAQQARDLRVPTPDAGRCGLYTEAIRLACRRITDKPVFAGVIGPYSLAGRLLDVSEIMVQCYDDPDMVHTVLGKATDFLISYILGYRDRTGAGGVVIAEPLAGLLSPALMEEFSAPYVRRIVEAVQTDDFLVIYHNCGNNVLLLSDLILSAGASAYHFGNAIDLRRMLEKVPSDTVVMGNIDPVGAFRNGTPEQMREAVRALMAACGSYQNFVISSGCDVPPGARWENIDAFTDEVARISGSR